MCVYSMGLAGATAPVTLAGAVAQANAEILSAVVLFQLVRPGVGCIYVADTGVLDMRAGAYAAAAPESVLITQAMVGLARRYDLPVMATGFTGDANESSFMSGSDAGMTALTSALMDPDLLCGAGMHDGAQMLSLPKILLDCELFRQCRRVRAGLTVDAEHLMEDVVAAVGPGGHYLRARETRAVPAPRRTARAAAPAARAVRGVERRAHGGVAALGRRAARRRRRRGDPRDAPPSAAAGRGGRAHRRHRRGRRPRAGRPLAPQRPITCASARRRSHVLLARLGVALAQLVRRRHRHDLERRVVEEPQLERVARLVGPVLEELAEQEARRLLAHGEHVVRRRDRELLGEVREAVLQLVRRWGRARRRRCAARTWRAP